MLEMIRTTVIAWAGRTSDREKLQHIYAALLVVVVFLSGLVALFDGTRSRQLMYISLAFLTTFVTNYIVWALVKTTLLDKLPRNTRNSRR